MCLAGGLEYPAVTNNQDTWSVAGGMESRNRVQLATSFEAAEEAEQREYVEADTEPFLGNQVDQSIQGVQGHSQEKTPGVTFVGEYTEKNKRRRHEYVQNNGQGKARPRREALAHCVEDLRDA